MGSVLHVRVANGSECDRLVCLQLQIAADKAVFGQTGPKVGSFDAGYGSTHMARLIGQKKQGRCGFSDACMMLRRRVEWVW